MAIFRGNGGDNILNGTARTDTLFGGAGVDLLSGGDGNDTLDGGTGADTLHGGNGNDLLIVDDFGDVTDGGAGTDRIRASVTYALDANSEILELTGTANIDATGRNGAADTLIGNRGNNVLDGLAGADRMAGGYGNDTYFVDNVADVIVELGRQGTDTVNASVSYTLSANVENLNLTGVANLNGTGNGTANTLTGNAGDNTLDGGRGADRLVGGGGNDTYIVDNAGDVVVGGAGIDTVRASVSYTISDASVEILTLTGTRAINGTGNSNVNTLNGNSGNNTLDGGAGADTMAGGAGNDVYIVDNIGDVVSEAPGAGTDTVRASVSYTISDADVENLVLTGNAAIDGTGNASANTLVGNAAANTLDGLGGADRMQGGGGDDTYIVDNVGDVVVELRGSGTDTIITSVSYTLGANVENLVLNDPGANLNGTGNVLDNVITGDFGDNTLDGGAGADVLTGNGGNDVYIVDNAGDVVFGSAVGFDTVRSSVTYTISDIFVEDLFLTGTRAINGTGNAASNGLFGNDAANTLDGGAGVDLLIGHGGNDVYIVDDIFDSVFELAGEGTDTILSSVSYVLPTNVEVLTLTGSANISATGTASADTLNGNAGNNTLDGSLGADRMAGGGGDDIYIVDNIADVVVESVGAGTDTVRSSVSYTLSANVENLELTGVGNINGTGNALDNEITGTSGANILSGGAGNDTLVGGLGNDTFVGGTGADVFEIQALANSGDVILDFATGQGDLIDLRNLLGGAPDSFLDSAAFTGGANNEVRVVSVGGDEYTVEVEIAGDGNAVADYSFTVFSSGGVTPELAHFILA